MQLIPSSVESLVMAALVLHNYLKKSSSRNVYCPHGLLDTESSDGELTNGLWRQDGTSESFLPLSLPGTGHNATSDDKMIRDTFKDYFVNEGAVEWQWNMI